MQRGFHRPTASPLLPTTPPQRHHLDSGRRLDRYRHHPAPGAESCAAKVEPCTKCPPHRHDVLEGVEGKSVNRRTPTVLVGPPAPECLHLSRARAHARQRPGRTVPHPLTSIAAVRACREVPTRSGLLQPPVTRLKGTCNRVPRPARRRIAHRDQARRRTDAQEALHSHWRSWRRR